MPLHPKNPVLPFFFFNVTLVSDLKKKWDHQNLQLYDT